MAKPGKPAGGVRLRIEAEVVDVRKGEVVPELVAYAFGHSGRLLARAALKGAKAEIELPATKEPEALRIVVGPAIDREDPGELLAELMRLEAPERWVRPGQTAQRLTFPLDRVVWTCWFRFCVVRGTLLKRVTTGGVHVDLPVCGAEIEIYEVDPVLVIFPRIPDLVLERIRELIPRPWPPPPPLRRIPGGIPFPPIPPGLGMAAAISQEGPGGAGAIPTPPMAGGIGIREEVMEVLAELRGGEEEEEAETGGDAEARADDGAERLFHFASGEATEVEPGEVSASLQALSEVPEIKSAARVSLSAFKASLVARPELLRPLLCWLWPPAVTMQLVATGKTDDCGKFRALFYRGCSTDTPDLYFKAYRRFGFFRVPIYAPLPIACHTRWNYSCGSKVTLYTTSPFAHTCPPCKPVIAPPHWVLAMAVGNTSLAAVRGTSVDLQPTTGSWNIGLTGGGAPFGGYIRLRFEFDNTLRTDLGVRYYRVRWRKVGSGNPFVDMTEPAWRHYAHMVGSTLMIEPFKLGPQPVGSTPNLFEIPPAIPPKGQWSIPDAVVDTTSAAFRSKALAPSGGGEGVYAFELTLFDSAGNPVNANTGGIRFRVPTTLDLTATIPTADAALLGLVTPAGRLVFRLRVDNNPCIAALEAPQMAGSVSADPCGLLRYEPGDSVTLEWTASHPNGFATFKHTVVRGAAELPPPVTSSGPVGPPPGVRVETHGVSDLLGACTIAGFAEALSVWATATDGWSPLYEYDRHRLQAFALAPEEG